MLFSASSSTVCSIKNCSASSFKLTTSRTSPFLHLLQFLQLTHLYGDSVPSCSTCHSFFSSPTMLYISTPPAPSSQWQWSHPSFFTTSSTRGLQSTVSSLSSSTSSMVLLNLSSLIRTQFCSTYHARVSAVR